MHSTKKILGAVLIFLPLFASLGVSAAVIDDEVPEVTARVARISFIRGEAQIRRSGGEEWERASLNLPLVEGDEIATDPGGRVEIQFNSYTHIRLSENSYFKLGVLRDEGVAVSLPEGTLSLRIWEFDKNRTYFEIDAPKTTIAVQQAGEYRVDAGKPGDQEIRVTVTEQGEARVYTEASGFTVKNDRSARIIIDGAYAGEWESASASGFEDEFDRWTAERDDGISRRLKDAYYGRYYDRDIYGAEDLNEHGEWIYTRSYGYVWRPYASATSVYSDWSPYRYGHWRWIPPYGWTWVNDEPWGWATYHHGRWIWDNGYWVWTPYGYYRYSRSWWSPALVVIGSWGNNVCWYPLSYHSRYYDYNRHYRRGWRRSQGGNPPRGGTPSPSPSPQIPTVEEPSRVKRPPLGNVPPTGVVMADASEFGKERMAARRPPLSLARNVLTKPADEQQTPPILPPFEKVSSDIKVEKPRISGTGPLVRTGAVDRTADAPVDEELRKARILGNRPPLQINTNQGEIKTPPPGRSEPRDTGAIGRPVIKREEPSTQPAPTYVPQPRDEERRRVQPPLRRTEQPRYEPPVQRDEPRYEPPKREERRYEPPPQRREEPKYEPPPQKREEPSRPPQKREDPPPQKSEPKSDPGKTPPLRRDKDGR